MPRRKLKVVMLGEGRVGKTSLLTRFLNNSFADDQASTVQAKMHSSLKMEVEGQVCEVAFWDTAGQERFHALGPIYYRDAQGAVLTYDITDKDSFAKVRVWLRELHQVVGENIAIVVVGNKCDLERERKVKKEEAESWCAEQGAQHFLASAKLDLNVSNAFNGLVNKIVTQGSSSAVGETQSGRYSTGAAAFGDSATHHQRRGAKVDFDGSSSASPPPKKEKKCCGD